MSLQVWLPLNGDLRNNGIANIDVTNNGATVNNNGKIGKCYSFGTAASRINIDSTPIKSFTEMSLTFWIKIISWNTNYATLFQAGIGTTPWASYIFGVLRNSNTSNLCFTISNGSTTSSNSYTTSNLELNTWYHLGFIYSNNHCKIYINGTLYRDYTTTINPSFSSCTHCTLGAVNNGSYQSNCLINDVQIYNHALSAAEVKEISRGLILHYKFSNNNTNLYDFQAIASKWMTEGVTKADYIDPQYGNVLKITTSVANKRIYRSVTNIWTQGQVYTVSFLAKAETNGTVVNMSRSIADFTPNFTLTTDWKWYSGKITSTATADTGTLSFKIVSSSGTVYLTNVKLEKGEIATPYTPGPGDPLYKQLGYNSNSIIDNSGINCNNGVITGILASFSDTSRYSSSAVFSGNQRIEADSLPSEVKTVSVWAKTTWESVSSPNYQFIFHDTSVKLCMGFASSGLITYVGPFNGGAGSCVATSGKYLANQWNHIVVIITGDTTRQVYINGQLATNNANNFFNGNLNKLLIGCRHISGAYIHYFNGQLSDFRAYATKLSETDILELYQMGAKIDSKNKFHTYELIEDNSTIKINKKGQLQINELNETTGINFDSTKDLNANELIEI